jgi:hypothetical protein
MTGKFNHRKYNIVFAGLSIAVFLTTILIAAGQGYHSYNDPQSALDQIDAARAYQNLYNEYYNQYSYNGPQSALDLVDIARANQMLYNYDSSDWEYWANLWLNSPY